ncbi:zf-HC2 domain-containing protein [Streptomyces sp. NPDC005077]|uniref:zf-HC2 domain-containing protein n=1 Tax=Streptomyces sp. NPDC005077 TaxID=3154292 RepID=UPI0033BC8990
MTGWHVGAPLAQRYASGTASETEAWSLEKHVEACEGCAARVSAAVRGQGAAAAVVDEVRAAVVAAAGRTDRAEAVRGSMRVPASPPPPAPRHYRAPLLAPALRAAGPALRGPWLVSVLLITAAAVALAYGARSGTGSVAGLPARPLLLLIAPVLPLAGVGVAYGRHADPVYELAASTPSGGLRLLLIRTAAVLGVSVPLLTAAGAVLPASAGAPGAVAWLLPAVAMTLAALALGSYTGCRTGASSVTAAWALAVVVPSAGAAPLGPESLADGAARYLAGPFAQSGWAAGALLCAALLAVRRRSFDHLEKL